MKILGHGNLKHSQNPIRNFCEGIRKSDDHLIRLTEKHELPRVNLNDYDLS